MRTSHRRHNLVLLAADTLRPDHLHCYGYAAATSPNIDRLAAEGARFTDYQAAHIPTHPAFTTLFSGVDPLYHGILCHSGDRQLPPSIPLLAERLHDAGYLTMGIDNMMAQQAAPSWFARGFDYFRVYRYTPGTGEATRLTNWGIDFLQTAGRSEQPFALFLHYFEPHTPYAPPSRFQRRFYQGDERAAGNTSLRRALPDDDLLTPQLLGNLRRDGVTDFDYVVAQYDGEIAFMDEEIGRLLDALDRAGRRDDTLVVFLSDHGEAFGEGGLYFDHHTLHDATTHCALTMRLPGVVAAGTVVDGLASSMDVTPTVLDLLGLPPIEPAAMAGRGLGPLLMEGRPVREDAPLGEASRQISHGIVTSEWRLIEPVTRTGAGRPVPDFRGRPRDPRPQLFHRPTDRSERRNVADEHPEVVSQLQARLRERIAAAGAFTGVADPFHQVEPSLPYDMMVAKLQRLNAPAAPIARGEPAAAR